MVNMQREFSPSPIDKEDYESIMVGNSRYGIEFDLKTTQMDTLPRLPIKRFHKLINQKPVPIFVPIHSTKDTWSSLLETP